MIETRFAINQHLGEPPMEQVIWRFMSRWKFADLLRHQALWFSRLDQMEDEFEGHLPKANLRPSYEALSEAVGPFLAHAHGFREVPGQALKWRVDRERPRNLVNCWYIGQEPSQFMWTNYAEERGDVAIRSVVRQVGEALNHPGATHAVFAWPISYIDRDRQEVTMKHFLGSFFVKGRSYEGEQELRFFLHLDQIANTGLHVAVTLPEVVNPFETLLSRNY